MNTLKTGRVALLTIPLLAIAVMAGVNRGSLRSADAPQDVIGLDRRVSMIEQRFYLIESRINRLEQLAAVSQRPPSQAAANDRGLELLRSQIEILERRLTEIDCGLVKLDERTLTTGARDARKGAEKLIDPCRLNPGTALRLSTRP